MKKIINYILIFVMLVSSPLQIFAQDVSCKPAISFDYDYYIPGQTPEYKAEFVAKLSKNLVEDYETFYDADTNFRSELVNTGTTPTPEDYYNAYGTTDKIKEAYNDFIYFNIHPKQSPYYIDTALIAAEGASDKNILYMLNRYETLTEDISKLLRKNNHRYEQERAEKAVRMIPSVIALTILEIYFGKIFIAAEAVKASNFAENLVKIGFFIALLGADIWLSDFIAREAQNIDGRLGQVVKSVGFYKIIVNSVEDTGLFKAAQQAAGADREAREFLEDTKFYRTYSKTDSSYKIEELDRQIEEAQKIVDFYNKGKVEHTVPFHKLIAGTLIKAYGTRREGIPEINKDNEEQVLKQIYNQNKYAMDLVRQEMLRTYYALRFIRAELSNIHDPLRFDRATIDLATVYKIMFVQKIDNTFIKFTDHSEYNFFADSWAEVRNLDKKIFYENPEDENNKIPTNLGYEVLDATSTKNTYPTLLSRAVVNYFAQLISIGDMEKEKAVNDDITAKVAKRTNDYKPDMSYLKNTNLTEKQKRACTMGYCGTK